MRANLSERSTRYYQVLPAAGNSFTVAAGGPAWVDTDITGSVVPRHAIAIYWQTYNSNLANELGIRNPGSAQDLRNQGMRSMVSGQGSNGHVELYQSLATNSIYGITGYWA